ncbi:MAG: cobalamin-dependent protein, partial [Coriobacteriia bacterium]|nr:cobalamin-dependent protein [Coriobacteriia bacterium]
MDKIKGLLAGFEDEALLAEVQVLLDGGADPAAIVAECQAAMVEIGDLFSAGELFVSDLMMAGAIVKEVNALVLPRLQAGDVASAGAVVLGTVRGDIHDIGKDIVATILAAGGFEVIDLGVDVEPAAFVAALAESGARVLALSCLLVSCYGSIQETVAAVEAAGLRGQASIIIGGGPIDETVVAYSGADAMGLAAQDAVIFA